MKKINIEITKAKIMSFSVKLNDDYPDVTDSIGLFTANDKQISTFTLSTENWHDVKFDLPVSMVNPIKDIAKELETLLIREVSNVIGLLEAPKKK